jgi:hypothetical protein
MRDETPLDRALRLACLATIALTALACLPALFVPLGFAAEGDALDYRVPILKWMLRHHAYPGWPWTFVDDYPMLGELLMLPFFAAKQELARLVAIAAYFGAGAFGAGAGVELAAPARERRRELFLFLFASLLGLQPLLVQATHVMVDNVAACFALGALYFLLRRRSGLSAAFLGAALATRYTVWGAAPGALLALWRLEAGVPRAARFRLLARYAGIALLPVLPFLLRNLALNGNPVFPLLEGLFHGRAVSVYEGWGRGTGLLSLALFPYDLLYTNTFVKELFDTRTYSGGFYVYRLGGLFYLQLAACLALAASSPRRAKDALLGALRSPRAQAAALFGLGLFVVWWYGSQQLRFLGAALVLLNLALLLPLSRRAPRLALVAFALLPLLAVAAVEQEAWRIAFGNEESFRHSAYVESAERCFARAGVASTALVGFHDRDALNGYFDYDFVFLPGSNLALPSPHAPAADYIYSGIDFRPVPGYVPWPASKPCLLKRSP